MAWEGRVSKRKVFRRHNVDDEVWITKEDIPVPAAVARIKDEHLRLVYNFEDIHRKNVLPRPWMREEAIQLGHDSKEGPSENKIIRTPELYPPTIVKPLKRPLANPLEDGANTLDPRISLPDNEKKYESMLVNRLIQDFKLINLTNSKPQLSALLEEFSVRFRHSRESQDYLDLMYAVHKRHQKARTPTHVCLLQSMLRRYDISIVSDAQGAAKTRMHLSDEATIEEYIPAMLDIHQPPFSIVVNGQRTKDLLSNLEAYEWLTAAMRRSINMNGVHPRCMQNHRQWLLTTLESNTFESKISEGSGKRPAVYTVEFELSWDLFGFLREQEYAEEDLCAILGRVVTLTGDGEYVQALPCREYMEQIWPLTSAKFLWLLERLVESPWQPHKCTLFDGTIISGSIRERSVFFQATGTAYGLAEAAEQLFWASTALRTPSSSSRSHTSLNCAKVSATYEANEFCLGADASPAPHIGTAYCKVWFESEPLDQATTRGNCWHNLFRRCVIVAEYPIPSRPSQRPGLEIPFDMMAALAGATRITPFGGHMMVKGFSTLLYPTSSKEDCIFWHLIHNEDRSRISFADSRVSLPTEMEPSMMELQPTDLEEARHIVGWAAKLKKNTGAMDASYSIGWSRLGEPTPELALEKVQISVGYRINVGGNFAFGRRERAVIIRDDDYISRLESVGEKFVVLHDIEVHIAWLVDGLSALLHLTRAHLEYNNSQDSYKKYLSKPETLKARGGCYGRKMAFETLSGSENMRLRLYRKDGTTNEEEETEDDAKFYCIRDAVEDMMHRLEQIIDHQEDERVASVGYRIRKSSWKQLVGFDFMDIAIKDDVLRPRASTLRADGQGWAKFTKAISVVPLFGRGFGELFEPIGESGDRNHCTNCYWNSKVPSQRDILAASVTELERIIKKHGSKSGNSWQLKDEFHLELSPQLFSTCSGDDRYECRQERVRRVYRNKCHSEIEQSAVQKESTWKSKYISKFSPHYNEAPLVNEDVACLDISAGGILLGMTRKAPPKRIHDLTDAQNHVVSQQNGSPRYGIQRTLEVEPRQPLAERLSDRSTAEDIQATAQINVEGMTLPERLRLPDSSSSAPRIDYKGKGKLQESVV